MKKRLLATVLCAVLTLTAMPQCQINASTQPENETAVTSAVDTPVTYINEITSFAVAVKCTKVLSIYYDDISYYTVYDEFGQPVVMQNSIVSTVWSSSNEAIAKVSQTGEVTGVSVGTAAITATYTLTDGSVQSYSAAVTVTDATINTKKVSINLYNLEKNSEGYYYPYDTSVIFDGLSADSVVTCDTGSSNLIVNGYNGNYTFCPKKTGTYTAVFYVDGKEIKCTVTVANAYFKRSKKSTSDGESKTWIEGSTMIALYKGETVTLKVKGLPAGPKIKWTSSNKKVAKVDKNGKVKAYNNGYATITASRGGIAITYEIGVSYKTAIKALRYATKNYFSTYSQPKRMQKGYYDCSSYVWFSYRAAGKYIGDRTNAPTAAGIANWCTNNGYMLMEGTVDTSKLLPGDLIFWTGADNGRYRGIYHIDLYAGNYSSLTVARSKFFGETMGDNVMIARPCASRSTLSKAVSSKTGNAVTFGGAYGADGYVVYRSESKYGTYKKIGKTRKQVYTYQDTNVKKGKTYYYKAYPYWKSSKTYKQGFSPIVSCKAKKSK